MEEAPIIQPMGYRFFPLSIAESKSAKYWGWNFISQNKDRLINIDMSNYEYQTYDRALTYIVHNNTVYRIERDFVDIDNNIRIFVGRQLNLQTDSIIDETPGGEQETI